MPLRASARPTADGAMRLHGRQTYGDLLDVTMLDVRQYRSLQPCPVGNSRRAHIATCADLANPARTMLGQSQESWLYDSFKTAERRWNLIGQGVLISPYAQKDADGQVGYFTDGWSGYAANRSRMIGALDDSGKRNAVFLGGDLHAFLASDIHSDFTDPKSPPIATEFVGTSITSDPAPDSFRDTRDHNPHVKAFENAYRGYMSLDVSHERIETRFRKISDRADPAASVSTLQSFVVEAGRPGVQSV